MINLTNTLSALIMSLALIIIYQIAGIETNVEVIHATQAAYIERFDSKSSLFDKDIDDFRTRIRKLEQEMVQIKGQINAQNVER